MFPVGLFKKFLVENEKHYSADEYHYRLGVFQDNLKKVKEMNAKATRSSFALNKFADLTAEEFKRYVRRFALWLCLQFVVLRN
jgi:hypothetical protein